MAATSLPSQDADIISNIFENMNYGPAPEADNVAKVLYSLLFLKTGALLLAICFTA